MSGNVYTCLFRSIMEYMLVKYFFKFRLAKYTCLFSYSFVTAVESHTIVR